MRTTSIVLAIFAVVIAVIGMKVFSMPDLVFDERASSTLNTVQSSGKLHVCYIEWPPTVIHNPHTGALSGQYVDMAKNIAETINAELVFHQSTWGTFPADLNSGRCDLSIAGTFSTIPRAAAVAFSRPIAYLGNSAVVQKNSPYRSFGRIDDFDKEGITVAVLNGEQGHEYVRQNFKYADINVLQGTDNSLPLVEVASGRADVGLHDSLVVSQFATQHPEVVDVFAKNPYNINPIAWATRYDDLAWLQFINTAITYQETTGKVAEFEQQYGAHWLQQKKELVTE